MFVVFSGPDFQKNQQQPLPSTGLCGDIPLPKVWSFHSSTDIFCVQGAGFLTESVQYCGWTHTEHRRFILVDISVLGPNKKGCHVVMYSLFSPTNPLYEEVVRQRGRSKVLQGSQLIYNQCGLLVLICWSI